MFVLLLLLWIVFNGKFTLEIFLIGVFISGLISLFCAKFLDYDFKSEIKFAKKIPLFFCYVVLLLKEIIVANMIVMKIILTKKKVKPILYTFSTDIKSETLRVLLSHSITLTPGTITVELIDNNYVIHCLDESMAEGMSESKFVQILRKMEG